MIKVKICGITDKKTIDVALEGNADYLGFVFYPPSPRHLSIEKAIELINYVDGKAETVGVFVNHNKKDLEDLLKIIPLNWVQLHGKEDKKYIEDLKSSTGIKVIKAISVSQKSEVEQAKIFEKYADQILFDSKNTSPLPGGTGQQFPWEIMTNQEFNIPWILAGGLNENNVEQAIKETKANTIDLSSSLEKEKGIKDPQKVKSFLHKIKNISI